MHVCIYRLYVCVWMYICAYIYINLLHIDGDNGVGLEGNGLEG